MKLCTIVGARPQFIKATMVSSAIRSICTEVLVHTGQHYDYLMSGIFLDQLNIPYPAYDLDVGSSGHGVQTGQMLMKVEEVLLLEKPDGVLVYGDTNSTLAGALAASKLHLPVIHVEAGLRSYNRAMPEEINRVLTDHVSTLLFCPNQASVDNLAREGITTNVHKVGDVLHDAVLFHVETAERLSRILTILNLAPGGYYLATVHRPQNTDDRERLVSILRTLDNVDTTVILPLHPRTRKAVEQIGYQPLSNLRFVDPVSYFDMLVLEKNALEIFTDSGGVQREAYSLGIPYTVLRDETEWNLSTPNALGDGHAAQRIAAVIAGELCS